MLFPYAESKRIVLRPATAEDGPTVYQVLFERGCTSLPTMDAFLETYNQGVAGRFLVQRRDSGETVGFTELMELSPAGHIRAGVHVAAGSDDAVVADAAALTVNFAFAMWRVRKVYFYTHEETLQSLGFGGSRAGLVQFETVLPDHLYFQGRLWDMHVHAIYRDRWDIDGTNAINEII